MKFAYAAAFGAALLMLAQSAEAVDKSRLTIARAKTIRGEKLLKKPDYPWAEAAFRAAIAAEPLWPPAYLGLGAALVAQGRFEEALATLAEAEKRFIAWEQELTLADLKRRQLAEQQMLEVQTLAAAMADRPNPSRPGRSAASQLAAAENRIQTEQFLVRERWHLEGFKAIPPQVFYLEGIAYLRMNRKEMGIEALEICLTVDNDYGLAHYNLAVALLFMGEPAEAKTHLDAALLAGVAPHAQFVADLELAQQ